MKTLIAVVFILLVSGCALNSGNNENKGDLKKSPCAMVTKPAPGLHGSATIQNGDKLELARREIRHQPVTNPLELKNG